MSKLDVGVGDDFPLDETPEQRGGHGRHHRRHRHMHEHMHRLHGHHHGHHRRHFGLGRFALLLVAAGLVALIVNHQLTAAMAFGLVGTGAGLLVLAVLARVFLHRRFHRHIAQQVS